MQIRSKVLKKAVAISAAAVLTFSMAACQSASNEMSPEEIITQATENLNNADSMSYETDCYMDMSAMGQTVTMDMLGTGNYIREPMTLSMDMKVDMSSMGAGEMSMSMYMVQDGDEFTYYIGSDDGSGEISWEKNTIDNIEELKSEMGMISSPDNFNVYATSGTSFVETGTEKINGTEATRYDGIITKEAIMEVMKASNMDQMFETMGLTEEAISSYSEGFADLPISIWVDKEAMMPVKYSIDMTAFMQSMMAAMMSQYDLGDTDLSSIITISEVSINIVVTGVNNLTEIEIPEEALNA